VVVAKCGRELHQKTSELHQKKKEKKVGHAVLRLVPKSSDQKYLFFARFGH
jgi:hypothetical protein